MLANSDAADDGQLKDIVKSTAAVVFLGTPHRGSEGMANVADAVRKAARLVLMDTNPSVLDALGLKTSDLMRCQEGFSRLWRAYDFRVKTFQEGSGLTRVRVGLLNQKVRCAVFPDQLLLAIPLDQDGLLLTRELPGRT